MKVYILYFKTYGSGLFGAATTKTKTMGVYSSEDRVKRELATIKEKCASNADSTITDLPSGQGFSMSSADCAPAWWQYEEQEVIE